MITQLAAGHPSLPWFRWFIFAGTLALLVSRRLRTQNAPQGKVLYWVAGGLLVAGALGAFGVMRL